MQFFPQRNAPINVKPPPLPDYSCCVWGYEKHSPLESIQRNAIRYFLGVGKNFPIAALYGDMGWIPVWITHAFTVIKSLFG